MSLLFGHRLSLIELMSNLNAHHFYDSFKFFHSLQMWKKNEHQNTHSKWMWIKRAQAKYIYAFVRINWYTTKFCDINHIKKLDTCEIYARRTFFYIGDELPSPQSNKLSVWKQHEGKLCACVCVYVGVSARLQNLICVLLYCVVYIKYSSVGFYYSSCCTFQILPRFRPTITQCSQIILWSHFTQGLSLSIFCIFPLKHRISLSLTLSSSLPMCVRVY